MTTPVNFDYLLVTRPPVLRLAAIKSDISPVNGSTRSFSDHLVEEEDYKKCGVFFVFN